MLRFLAILVLSYFVIKFLRGLFQTNVIIKNYHYNSENKTKNYDEGEVKISNGGNTSSSKSDDMGEYVDYEEVKD